MDIIGTTEDGILRLAFAGNFDTTDVEAFHSHVEGAVDAQQFKVLVDAAGMNFINSTALGALLRAQKRLQQYGGDLAVSGLTEFAAGVFRTLGLDRKVRCFDSAADGVAYLHTVGAEGVGVDGDERMGFLFTGAEQIEVAGADPRVGTLKSIGEYGMLFQWENLDSLDTDTMFAPGAPLKIEFRLPLYHESHTFAADAKVVDATVTAGNRITVQTRFTSLRDVERRAIQQFVRDLRYLKGELSD